jgi:hypothetical protein
MGAADTVRSQEKRQMRASRITVLLFVGLGGRGEREREIVEPGSYSRAYL